MKRKRKEARMDKVENKKNVTMEGESAGELIINPKSTNIRK